MFVTFLWLWLGQIQRDGEESYRIGDLADADSYARLHRIFALLLSRRASVRATHRATHGAFGVAAASHAARRTTIIGADGVLDSRVLCCSP